MVVRFPTLPARSPAGPIASGLALLAATWLAACAAEQPAPPAERDATPGKASLDLPADTESASETITADALRTAIAYLSSDELEGRAPGTQGDVAARHYIAEQLAAAGAQPAGDDDGWEQRFNIVGVTTTQPAAWRFAKGSEQVSFAPSTQFIASIGTQQEHVAIDGADVVFVGYGIDAPEFDWDDYKGTDLSGKVIVMLNNDPDWDDTLFAGNRRLYYGRWTYKYESAGRQGAVAAIIIHTDPSAGYGWNVVQSSWSGTQFELPAAGDEARVPVAAWLTYEAAEKLFSLAGHELAASIEAAHSRDFKPIDLGVKTSLTLEATVARDVTTANVLGMIPGSDPQLRDQVVVLTAHHDHLGRGAPDETGDDIYNGALDNASGVSQVLAIARAFAHLSEPPRRSVLFTLVAGEEQGLLGSKYFASHPPIPPGRIAANINFDAGNIWGHTSDLIFIGYGKSSLDAVVEAAAATQGRHVVGDQFPDKGYFYRSDQLSLAKIGVPAFYLDGGTELIGKDAGEAARLIEAWTQEHYHQPSDELRDDWNFDGMIDDTRIGFLVALQVAEADAMPQWNPGDEFEAARQDALAALGDAAR